MAVAIDDLPLSVAMSMPLWTLSFPPDDVPELVPVLPLEPPPILPMASLALSIIPDMLCTKRESR